MDRWVFVVALLALLAYNLRATLLIWRSDEFEQGQKLGQTAFVWLVPIIGATVVMNVIKPDAPMRGGDESDG